MSALLKKIEARQRSQAKFGGLDQLLFDISPVETSEFLIFKRTQSLLMEKINLRIKSGELADYVQKLIQKQMEGYCLTCWKPKRGFGKATVRADGYCDCNPFDDGMPTYKIFE